MRVRSKRFILAAVAALAVAAPACAERVVQAPVPQVDAAPTRKLETAVFAGGCYWGVEGVFSHVKGVHLVVSGFAGGPKGKRVDYEAVSGGDTGFAEAVRVTSMIPSKSATARCCASSSR